MQLSPRHLFQPRRTLLFILGIQALTLMIGVLLASQPLTKARGAEVRVPLAPDTDAGLLINGRWLILLRRDGGAFVDGEAVPEAAMTAAVVDAIRARPGTGVRIESETGVPFHRLRAAMEACARAGLPYVDVSTRVEGGS